MHVCIGAYPRMSVFKCESGIVIAHTIRQKLLVVIAAWALVASWCSQLAQWKYFFVIVSSSNSRHSSLYEVGYTEEILMFFLM